MGDNCLHEHMVQSLSVQGNRRMASRYRLCLGLVDTQQRAGQLHIRNYRRTRGEKPGGGAH